MAKEETKQRQDPRRKLSKQEVEWYKKMVEPDKDDQKKKKKEATQ